MPRSRALIGRKGIQPEGPKESVMITQEGKVEEWPVEKRGTGVYITPGGLLLVLPVNLTTERERERMAEQGAEEKPTAITLRATK